MRVSARVASIPDGTMQRGKRQPGIILSSSTRSVDRLPSYKRASEAREEGLAGRIAHRWGEPVRDSRRAVDDGLELARMQSLDRV